jgi:hypothetical protein
MPWMAVPESYSLRTKTGRKRGKEVWIHFSCNDADCDGEIAIHVVDMLCAVGEASKTRSKNYGFQPPQTKPIKRG